MSGTVVIGRPVDLQPVTVGSHYPAVVLPSASAEPQRPSLERRNTRTSILAERGWPAGLTHAVATSIEAFPVRFVVVDNSGSMNRMDGTRFVSTASGDLKSIKATRWAELGDTIKELTNAVTALGAETHVHLLNPTTAGQYFVLCGGESGGIGGSVGAPADASAIQRAMSTSPTGSTPLTESVQLVASLIAPAAQNLRKHGQQAVVVLATDGLPNDPTSFLAALHELQRLPVWLVVRLCTDEEEVVGYWSDLDAQLEAPLEVLDDVAGEALEVYRTNPWLTYAPALHLARTMGLHEKLFDLLDERALLPSQCKQLIERLLGCEELVEPEIDELEFLKQVKAAVAKHKTVYNPNTGRMAAWVDVGKLQKHMRRVSGKGGDCAIL